MNCHGCKWLDRYKKDGNGYCCMVERTREAVACIIYRALEAAGALGNLSDV